MSFEFNTVARTNFGAGKATELGAVLQELGIDSAFIVTDPGIVQHKLLDGAIQSLREAEIRFSVFSDVVADPPEETVLTAVEQAKSKQCQAVIGFGGGSSMDVAKLVAVLLTETQELSEIYGVDQVRGGRYPLIQVPTTSGTGSEATAVAIVTTGESTKAGVVCKQLYADYILLDPELTLGLPAHVTAATGIDAMVHAIEAYTSKRLKNPISDMLALEALRLMSASIHTAVKQGDDLAARSDMLLGAMLAGQAFSNSPVGAVHALAYPLGGIYHIPHGLSNSLVLPHVLRFNGSAAGELYRELAAVILPESNIENLQNDEIVESLASYFLDLAKELGLQTTLREMDIAESAVTELAEQSMLQQRLLINNPREVLLDDAKAIYQAAY